ncbi:hypothetical protein M426DRAFT_59152 [Hypoxylon sp. CI-4A]|nr:hypothetical protein M426DRAFT_59152 [Hypoxylon sp. CI-4A]
MDGKVPSEEPPPYTAASIEPGVPGDVSLGSLTTYLQYHVSSLPNLIRESQQAREAEWATSDAQLLDYIVPIVEEFLVDLGARHVPVPLATLTLIPATAVPKNAVLSSQEDIKRRGEVCRVSRVSVHSAGKDMKPRTGSERHQSASEDPDWAPGQEFTDWGRFGESGSTADNDTEKNRTCWWDDEEMARRLANYLRPKKEEKTHVERPSVVQAVVEHRIPAKKEKKSWPWGKRASSQKSPEASVPIPTKVETAVDERQQEEQQGATMVVTAEEVVFRQENEFGIFESIRGWGIVVAVKMKT